MKLDDMKVKDISFAIAEGIQKDHPNAKPEWKIQRGIWLFAQTIHKALKE